MTASAAGTAMNQALCTRTAGFKPMTTALQTSFLPATPGNSGAARLVAHGLRTGRKLNFGEIEILDARDALAAQTTTTCALL